MAIETFESQSLWYQYKTKVWLEKSEQTDVVHNIMRVLRAIHNSGEIAYVSVPVTSGRFLYDLMLSRPSMSKADLIEAAIAHNYRKGWNFVEDIRKRRDCPILYPADLIPAHQEWEQEHFQALWLSIIAEKSTEVHMAEGWAFSNGATEEFTHVWQLRLGLPKHPQLTFYNTKENEESEKERMKNIKVYDHDGNLMSIDDGIQALHDALGWLGRYNFRTYHKLEKCLGLLLRVKEMMNNRFVAEI